MKFMTETPSFGLVIVNNIQVKTNKNGVDSCNLLNHEIKRASGSSVTVCLFGVCFYLTEKMEI